MSAPLSGDDGDRVVDASVLVKLFLPEQGSSEADILLEQAAAPFSMLRAVPDFVFLECANVFRSAARGGRITIAQAHTFLERLYTLPLRAWPAVDLVRPALDLALVYDLSVYDATYLALADRLAVPLVTADVALVRRVGGLSARVRLL